MSEVIEILKKVGGILENDHFVGASGLHFNTYINKDFLYPHTRDASSVGRIFAEKYKDKNIEVVVAPALGGIILAQWTAYHLSNILDREICSVHTEKTQDNDQVFNRGYDNYVKGKNVLIVEDIVTTGGSLLKTANAVREVGGNIVGVCAMVNKNKDLNIQKLGIPFESLGELFIDTYSAEECPLCKNNIPINIKVGHGKKFLESKK